MTAAAAARPGKVQAWRMAVRPPTLSASVSPVLVGWGVAIALDGFRIGPAVAALVVAAALQIGANFANDVFDFRRGADTPDRLGPPRVTQSGILTEREVFGGMITVFVIATIAGLYLAFDGGWTVVIVGVVCILGAIAYSGGPFPAAYHALGDVLTFVFFGIVAVVGTVWVQTGETPALAWFAGVPVGFTCVAILVVNNLRDIPTDAKTGKTTLAVVIGERATRLWYAFLLAAAFGTALATMYVEGATPYVALSIAALPMAVRLFRSVLVQRLDGRPLNLVLKNTARFHLVFGVLYAVGLALAAM